MKKVVVTITVSKVCTRRKKLECLRFSFTAQFIVGGATTALLHIILFLNEIIATHFWFLVVL